MRRQLLISVIAFALFIGAKYPGGVVELPLGAAAPDFKLRATDDSTYTFGDLAGDKGTLVVYTCNHCPFAVAYEERLVALAAKRAGQGITVTAISCNDAEAYPDDGFAAMKVRASEAGFNFPYLFDESQDIALLYGPKVTPHVFLFDSTRTLIYRGRIDDSAKEHQVKKRELDAAIDAYLSGKPIPDADTKEFGCSIKWKPEVLKARAGQSE